LGRSLCWRRSEASEVLDVVLSVGVPGVEQKVPANASAAAGDASSLFNAARTDIYYLPISVKTAKHSITSTIPFIPSVAQRTSFVKCVKFQSRE
jgi:hypothetical protein